MAETHKRSRSAIIKTVMWNYLVEQQDGYTFGMQPKKYGLELKFFGDTTCDIIFVISGTEDNICALEIEVPEAMIDNDLPFDAMVQAINEVLLKNNEPSLDVRLYQTNQCPIVDSSGILYIGYGSRFYRTLTQAKKPTRWNRFLASIQCGLNDTGRYLQSSAN